MHGGVKGSAAVLLALTAACSSDGGAAHRGTALDEALRHVRNDAANRAFVEFGQPKAAVAANGGLDAHGPYYGAVGFGANALLPDYRMLPPATGIDVMTARYAVTAGNPPGSGTLLAGVALSNVDGRLKALGATPSRSGSATTYRLRADNAVAEDDALARAVPGIVNRLNVIQVDGRDVRLGASTAAVDQTRAPGNGLLDAPGFRGLVGCLGDVLAADLTDRPAVRTAGLTALGVGASGAKGRAPTEILCIAASHPDTIAARMRAALANGRSTKTGGRWSERLLDAKVTVHDGVVRLAAHPPRDHSPGELMQAAAYGDLPGLS